MYSYFCEYMNVQSWISQSST